MTDTPLLSSLHLPEDIPGLSLPLKLALAQELRDTIIRVVTKNGGHLAPSLGVVELTIALLSCFDPARDPIVWDVIGDGALSGGMALEALNQAGGMGKRLIVILNDNKMSISENTGALSRFLSRNLSHSTVMHI